MNFLRRAGFVALGAVYLALGVVAVRLPLVHARRPVGGFPAAFRYLLAGPYGWPVLAAIACGLAAFTLARLADAADSRVSTPGRAVALADALGHAALTWGAVALLLRIRRGLDTRSALEWILGRPWGPSVLTVAGIAIVVIGAIQVAQGISGRLRRKPSPQRLGRTASGIAIRVGRFGYTARGIVTAIVGWFLIRAARDLDPGSYKDMGGALGLLQSMRFGPVLLVLAGAGLAAYGAYLAVLGLFSRKP